MTKKPKDGFELGYVWLNKRAIFSWMSKLRLYQDDMKRATSKAAWRGIVNEERVRFDTAFSVADRLGVDVMEIYHERTIAEISEVIPDAGVEGPLRDWKAVRPFSGMRRAANGLKYFVWQLEHRNERKRFARAKRYELTDMPTDEAKARAHWLSRHGEICNALARACRKTGGAHLFPDHITTVQDVRAGLWWSLDEWLPGEDLELVLEAGPDGVSNFPQIMKNLVQGLQILHGVGVICRELSPRSISVLDRLAGEVVVADFELGKLLDGSPTVSDTWPENQYRAPEAENKELTPDDMHVDLYSWARIVTQAVCGDLPPRGEEGVWLDAASLTPKVREIVKRCLDDDPKKRPQSADEVARAIRRWK